MKAQRRHELHRNELLVELLKALEFVKKWRVYVVWGIVLGALAVLTVVYMVRSRQSKRQSLQTTYERLTLSSTVPPQAFLDGMASLAESSDEQLAAMATVQTGNFYYWRFLTAPAARTDPQRRSLANQAAAYFRRAIRDFPDQPVVIAHAHLALAKLAESEGDFAAATKEYQAITTATGLTGYPVVSQAQQGLDRLDDIRAPVRMATTTSAPAATAPSTAPAAEAESDSGDAAEQGSLSAGD